ncbi:MAG TPA: hypothetical protein PLL80_00560 [Candidatus Pacearchaeota archaeon]|nr:hypothetical protein [Candidatus Pacearchaeota archaeon]HOK94021.1 hypothetical protein [Candidatus Pacearchaeota archaeon]HPO75092.1 hypothetical protein [Candidatus Pacearchaeota archaeon]
MYEDQIEQKRKYIQSLEREIGNLNYQQDVLENKIRQYEIAQQRSPQSASAYSRQIDSLRMQIDNLRSKRIYTSEKLQNLNRELSLLEKREAEVRTKQSQGRYFKERRSFDEGSKPGPGFPDNFPPSRGNR